MQKIMDMGISLGFFNRQIPLSELMDRSFVPEKIEPAKIDMSRMQEIIKQ
jgi:hypothetical protein